MYTTSLYALIHGLADTASIGFFFYLHFNSAINTTELISLLIIYNVLSFGLQSIFGHINDTIKKPHLIASLGLFLISIGLFTPPIYIAAIIIGIGSALFHVGGGIISINSEPKKKATMLGVFLAPGALGLSFGLILGTTGLYNPLLFSLLLLVSSCAGLVVNKQNMPTNTETEEQPINKLIFILLFGAILLASLIEFSISNTWKQDTTTTLLIGAVIALGRALGGFLGDSFNFRNVLLSCLALSFLLYLMSPNNLVLISTSLLFLSLATPLLFMSLINQFSSRTGLGYGLAKFATLLSATPILLLVFFDIPVTPLLLSSVFITVILFY